jgi:DNA-binding MarR family transcriptional regulator
MPSERDLVAGVVQLSNLLNRRLGPLFEKAKITPQQWAVLSLLAEAGGPMSLAAIARGMMVSKQNMTGMISRLEQLGLAERGDDPTDLRSARVQLTRRGKTLVEKLRPAYDEWHARLASQLGERDVQTLTRTVDRLIADLEAS